jgi:hypothetical protein
VCRPAKDDAVVPCRYPASYILGPLTSATITHVLLDDRISCFSTFVARKYVSRLVLHEPMIYCSGLHVSHHRRSQWPESYRTRVMWRKRSRYMFSRYAVYQSRYPAPIEHDLCPLSIPSLSITCAENLIATWQKLRYLGLYNKTTI